MPRPLAIGFLVDYFSNWMGGAQFLANIVHAIEEVAASQRVRVELLLSARRLGRQPGTSPAGVTQLARDSLRVEGPLKTLLDGTSTPQLAFYDDLPTATRALGIDVLGPTGDDLGPDFPVPWFGYIPDFQHQYLDHFFTYDERVGRDRHFRTVVENAHGLLVNSNTVIADIERFYPAASRRKQVLRLPQMLPAIGAPADLEATAARHGLQRPFLLSCSQRWLHKQHPLVLRAFADFVGLNPQLPVDLVFTGETSDYRDPSHAQLFDQLVQSLGLAGRVHVLGMIPRAEQLALIQLSIALIQASLFEGGPGASGALEAALLGTPVIASDIGPNRELTLGQCLYFDSRSELALSARISEVVARVAAAQPAALDRCPPFDAQALQVMRNASALQLLGTLRGAVE